MKLTEGYLFGKINHRRYRPVRTGGEMSDNVVFACVESATLESSFVEVELSLLYFGAPSNDMDQVSSAH